MKKSLLSAIFCAVSLAVCAGEKLSGTPIGTREGWNYQTASTELDIQHRAFDGDPYTYFASDAATYTWVGLDLGQACVIDRVGWMPITDVTVGPDRVVLAVIQGANREDWLDAVPLHVITDRGTLLSMSYADVDCSRGFRYVRYVTPCGARCNIAELEFYGTPGPGDDSHLWQPTDLPLVCINTVDAEEPYDKENSITANIIVIDCNAVNVDASGGVRERGNVSRTFPKKPWRIKFDKKQRVLDAPAKAKKWTLINNYGDKSLMRNILAFEIARRVEMPYVPYCRPVDVILNGEYKGCYQLCDQVEVNPGRLEITEMEPEDIEGEALTGGYFLEVDAYAYDEPEGEWFVTTPRSIPVIIKSPDDGGTPEQYAYISRYMNDVVRRVFSQSPDADYRDLFDVPSFVRHFIVGELSGNTDTYWSTFLYKERADDKIYTGPVWDFDIAFDNDYRIYPLSDITDTFLFASGKASGANNMIPFARKILLDDARTADDIATIWSEARNHHGLSYESLTEFIDATADALEQSQRLNFMRWPILSTYVHMNPTVAHTYAGEVDRLKTYLRDRIPVLDALMHYRPSSGIAEAAAEQLHPRVEGRAISLASGTFGVYTPDGRQVFSGSGRTPALSPGLYIVRTASGATRLLVP
ncbi:MAG: CotH kinase family protein [Muribaculaceae bacterium]|nr:CotH kinase family protein [Muribaculaceae bacterium]